MYAMYFYLIKLFGEKCIFYLQLSYADIALYFNSTWPAFVKVSVTSHVNILVCRYTDIKMVR